MATEGYVGLFVDGIEEWSQLFVPCNWRTFHPVHFQIEDDRLMGGVEATLIVLGLGFRVRWNYAATETVEKIKRRVADIRREFDSVETARSDAPPTPEE